MPNFDPMAVWSLIKEERVTTGGSVPAILNFMRQVPDCHLRLGHFRCFITGAAPMPIADRDLQRQKMQVDGATPSPKPAVAARSAERVRPEQDRFRRAPAMFTEIKVRDSEGNMSSRGTGEVVIKGTVRHERILEPS